MGHLLWHAGPLDARRRHTFRRGVSPGGVPPAAARAHPAAAKSQLLCTNCLAADVLRTLTTRNATVNLHNFGVDVESFQSGALGKAFSVLSTNIDTRGRMFASTIEAKGGAPISVPSGILNGRNSSGHLE